MPDVDAITKAYMEDNATFADAFNFLLFDGEQVVHPEELTPLDPNELSVFNEGDLQTTQKHRD